MVQHRPAHRPYKICDRNRKERAFPKVAGSPGRDVAQRLSVQKPFHRIHRTAVQKGKTLHGLLQPHIRIRHPVALFRVHPGTERRHGDCPQACHDRLIRQRAFHEILQSSGITPDIRRKEPHLLVREHHQQRGGHRGLLGHHELRHPHRQDKSPPAQGQILQSRSLNYGRHTGRGRISGDRRLVSDISVFGYRRASIPYKGPRQRPDKRVRLRGRHSLLLSHT